MKKALLCSVLFLFVTIHQSVAQKQIPFVNPGKVIKEALVLRDSQRYDDASKKLLEINKSDTSYVYMLTELASTYLSAEKFKEAIETTSKALNSKSNYQLRLMLIRGNAFDHAGMPDSSIAVYQLALKKFPYNYLVYYNMGITYTNQKKHDLAITAFQNAIRLNPYHASSHLVLGRISALMGRYTQAMLSIETYLTLEPNSERSNKNLVFLNNFLNNALGSEYEKITPSGKNAFQELDQVIGSGLALNKGYKLKLEFDAPVSRQSQLLFESLQYQEKTGDFWMEYYVPYFLEVKKNNFTEPYLYRILTSAPDKNIASQLKKRSKAIESMKQLLGEEISKINNNHKIVENGKERMADAFLNDDNMLVSMGKYKPDGKTRYGRWTFYYVNGEMKEDGTYTDEGKLDGKWNNYNSDGSLSYVENYSNGVLNGEYTGYFPDGSKKYTARYVNGEPVGEVQYFYECGAISSIVNFKGENKNGKGISYYRNGAVKEEYFYKNDSLDGENRAYFPDGKLKWLNFYKSDKLHGKITNYYHNGKVESELEYVDNELNGSYKSYFDNGRLYMTGIYKKGNRIGEWKEFNRKGVLKEVNNYDDKGNLAGETKGYDEKGKPYYSFLYEKGKLKQYNYYRNDVVSVSQKVGNGAVKAKGYYEDGSLLCEGTYNGGQMDGEWIYYYKCGLKKFQKSFKEGIVHGPFISYYKTGGKNEETSYSDGDLNGYYKKFNVNGIVLSEGWYVNGKQEGKWLSRGEDGTLKSENYYIAGNLNGYSNDYAPDQKLQFTRYFGNNIIKSLESFDPAGKCVSHIDFTGKSEYIMPYMDGTVRAKGEFGCNELNSTFTFYYKNGKPEVENQYLHDSRHGVFKAYSTSGAVIRTGSYEFGNKTGNWKYFYENGNLSRNIFYKNNNADSLWLSYHENGKLKSAEKYEDDELTDTAKYYNPLGEFIVAIIYNAGEITGFQYDGPSGVVVKNILPTDTGTFISYYKNGKISASHPYKYGNLIGTCTFYYSNGNKLLEYSYKNKLRDGKLTEYYLNGKVKKIENYLNSDYHGTFQTFREDGTPESSKEYKNDDAHGTFIYYDKKGNKERTESYWGDILL